VDRRKNATHAVQLNNIQEKLLVEINAGLYQSMFMFVYIARYASLMSYLGEDILLIFNTNLCL